MSRQTILPSAVFEPAQDLRTLPDSLRLRSLEWGILFSATGRHTVAQIGDLLGVSEAARDLSLSRLLELGLLRERELTYSEYLKAAATDGSDEQQTLAQFLRKGATWPSTEAVAPPPLPSPVEPTVEAPPPPTDPVTMEKMGDYDPTVTRAVPTVTREEVLAFRPLESPTSSPASPPVSVFPKDVPRAERSKRMSLRALMSFILDRAPDLNSGQLDIYRVFIRVDTKLLKRNGINTLRFEEDFQVDDPELQEAIAGSLQSTLGLSCPHQVYV